MNTHILDCTTIYIPQIVEDERIGSVFNELFKLIDATESASTEHIEWDFRQFLFFILFFLAPLTIFKQTSSRKIATTNVAPILKSYFETIHFEDCYHINKDSCIDELRKYESRTYIPICSFDVSNNAFDKWQSVIQNIIQKQSKCVKSLTNPLSYYLSELFCNISQHSKSQYAFIYSQYLERNHCLELCIADTGSGVYSSYVLSEKYLDQIRSEAEALKLANEGYSTKNLPNAENRGYGLSTTKRMLVEGMGGSFFMLSGGAFHRHNKKQNDYINLPPEIYWQGTIILLRIPTIIDKKFDIYQYIS